MLEDYEQLLDVVIGAYPDALIYLMSVSPVKPKAADRYPGFTQERIDAFNAGLLTLAAERNVYYLHIADLLRDETGALSDEYGTGDGIHLRRAAYDLLAEYLYTHAVPLPDTITE